MSNSDAPMLVGEPLIQVISETVNKPSTWPDLFTPPPSPSPPLDSDNLMDGSGDRPPELQGALLRLQNSGHHLQVVMRFVERAREHRAICLFFGRYSHN